mmetsp:Transcript_20621/g.31466  ORF Transcript_20621/g.31466 Transcript_20621/m.31466 type:complete len:108 (+) Transcript_20621:2103-2426(+)
MDAIFQRETEPKLVVSVLDTGVGITLEEQTRLFKLFGTIKRTRAVNTRGIGLGLSISKMISEEFGGRVAVLSSPGIGSAFLASLKILPEAPSVAESEERAVRVAQKR